MTAEQQAAVEQYAADMAAGRARIDALPIIGWVWQFDNGLCVGFTDGDPRHPFIAGLPGAHIYPYRPMGHAPVRNGKGEAARIVEIAAAREKVLDDGDKTIAFMIEKLSEGRSE